MTAFERKADVREGHMQEPVNVCFWLVDTRFQVVIDHDIRINGHRGANLRLIAVKEGN